MSNSDIGFFYYQNSLCSNMFQYTIHARAINRTVLETDIITFYEKTLKMLTFEKISIYAIY